jgi:diacylglycerol kinase family enzyme
MKIRFIVNPISGTGKQRGIEEVIEEYTDFEYDIVFTNKSGDATRLSQIAIDEKIDVVIAVGGDGTVNECAKAIIGSKTALGVIPCGSGNGFAFHFGI